MPPACDPLTVLLVRARGQACALPLRDLIETMRPLPVSPIADMPAFMSGLAVVRGVPVPVLELGMLLGAPRAAATTRFVTVRAAGRVVVLAVDEVLGIRRLPAEALDAVTYAHARGARAALIAAVTTVEKELVIVLRADHVLAFDSWRQTEGAAAI